MILDMFDQTVAVRCRNLFRTPLVLSETFPNARTKTASGCAFFTSTTEVLMCYKPCKRRPGESMFKRKHFFRWNLAWSNWSMFFCRFWGCRFDWNFGQDGCRCLLSFAECPSEAIYLCKVHGMVTVYMKIPLYQNNPARPYRALPNLSSQR